MNQYTELVELEANLATQKSLAFRAQTYPSTWGIINLIKVREKLTKDKEETSSESSQTITLVIKHRLRPALSRLI